MDYDFPYIGNVIIPTDFHSIIFQRGRYTTNQIYTEIENELVMQTVTEKAPL
jgi:hypothetical protein